MKTETDGFRIMPLFFPGLTEHTSWCDRYHAPPSGRFEQRIAERSRPLAYRAGLLATEEAVSITACLLLTGTNFGLNS